MITAEDTFNCTQVYATTYDQKECDIGFVHLGLGAFHRAHQAVYIDDYMQATRDLSCGIAAVNLRASEAVAFEAVKTAEQGYLLKTTSPDGERHLRLVRSHCAFEDWSSNPKTAEELLCLPSVHTITVTVTESGYYLNEDWSLNVNDPTIASEIAGETSSTVYAYLANAIRRRVAAHGQALNILCCDNIRSNGHMLEANFLSYLHHTADEDLAQWVRDNVTFPCSMVDRITPRATDDLFVEMDEIFPGQNLSPIHGESFIQWVLEDNFKAPMPDLTKSGVEVVADVHPYEETKIRILNGGHTGLCYFGALAGHNTFDAAFNDPDLRAVFNAFEIQEVLPGLDMPLPFDKHDYLAKIADRFSNEAIADHLERICMDGYSKVPIYIRPTLESCFRQGINPEHSIACIASWYVYARRFADGRMQVHYNEPYWNELKPLLANGQEETFATTKKLWADVPVTYPQFVSQLISAIEEMELKWPI